MTFLQPTDKQNNLASRSVREVYPVSRLVRESRLLLENSFPLLWVEGEISNLAMPASGHIYFTLKDEAAQVRCAMFRNRNRQLRFTPENGMQVLLRVRVTLYEGRGEFQLVVEHMEESGSGALQRAYEALKHRLGEEGLFAQDHKQTLPTIPETIGVVSSPDGAAVHDILSVINRRFPAVKVILYPVPVQGEGAAAKIAAAIQTAVSRAECDVLIIGRGGGSLEDLWSFNDEALARTIFACPIPTISAVGHEIDFTIADFVADVRAPTPSAAAELAVPEASDLLRRLASLNARAQSHMQAKLAAAQRHISHLHRQLPKPQRQLMLQATKLGGLERRAQLAWSRSWQQRQQQLDYLTARLKHPTAKIQQQTQRVNAAQRRLNQAMQHQLQVLKQAYTQQQKQFQQINLPQQITLRSAAMQQTQLKLSKVMQQRVDQCKARLQQQMRTLAAVSPLSTLERGYSIATQADSNAVLVNAGQVKVGDAVKVRLHQGSLDCEVKNIENN